VARELCEHAEDWPWVLDNTSIRKELTT
jgi:hypothetical protein